MYISIKLQVFALSSLWHLNFLHPHAWMLGKPCRRRRSPATYPYWEKPIRTLPSAIFFEDDAADHGAHFSSSCSNCCFTVSCRFFTFRLELFRVRVDAGMDGSPPPYRQPLFSFDSQRRFEGSAVVSNSYMGVFFSLQAAVECLLTRLSCFRKKKKF